MSAGIDSVLQAAVDGGVVPQVVAMAADEGGRSSRVRQARGRPARASR